MALCVWPKAFPTGWQLIIIDKNDEFRALQDKYFKLSDYRSQIKQLLSNARYIIPSPNDNFELFFLDADKRHYPEYFEMILPKMNQGGIILFADNVLWYGKVVDENARDAETSVLKKYNEILAQDNRVEAVILPVRDGLSVAVEK